MPTFLLGHFQNSVQVADWAELDLGVWNINIFDTTSTPINLTLATT